MRGALMDRRPEAREIQGGPEIVAAPEADLTEDVIRPCSTPQIGLLFIRYPVDIAWQCRRQSCAGGCAL
jgi:hypothetical protein